MEQRVKRRKNYQSASYLTSGAVFFGTLLFLISRSLGLLILFSNAVKNKKAGTAMPVGFTFWGISGTLLLIGVCLWMFLLLLRYRRRRTQLRRSNLFLLLNALFVVWGVAHAVSNVVSIITAAVFDYLTLLDFLSIAAALIVPSVLLQIADRTQAPPYDTPLLACAIAGTALPVISILIIVISAAQKSYTVFPFLRDFFFRAAILLFGIAGLQKALKIRSELPLTAPVEREPDAPAYRECPDCGRRIPASASVCPRCGYELKTASLFSDESDDGTAEPAPVPNPAGEPKQESAPAEPVHVEISDGTAVCARCGKRIPRGLATCPHCGYFPGDPEEPEEEPPVRSAGAEAFMDPLRSAARPPSAELPVCPQCGKRIPLGLATCPHCGYFPGDEDAPDEEPSAEPADDTSYQRLFPDDADEGEPSDRSRSSTSKRRRIEAPHVKLNERNSIVCPQCGRRFFAGLDECPYCGFGLYDD